MGVKVCQLLGKSMPSCLSSILPSFVSSFWLRSNTQNQTEKRNHRMKMKKTWRIQFAGGKKPQEEKQKLDKMQMQQEKNQDRKRKNEINRKKRRRKGIQQKPSQETWKQERKRKEDKGKLAKTKPYQTITPWYTILDVRCSNGNLSTNSSCKVCLRFKRSPSFCRFWPIVHSNTYPLHRWW